MSQDQTVASILEYINAKVSENQDFANDKWNISLDKGTLVVVHDFFLSKSERDSYPITETSMLLVADAIAVSSGTDGACDPLATELKLIGGRNSVYYQRKGKSFYKERKNEIVIEFSNRNRICPSLCNAFNALLKKVAASTPVEDVADPFSQPILSDVHNFVELVESNGVFQVPITLNGVLKLNFIFDSGASDVSLPPDVVLTLVRTGTVSENDFIGEQTYKLADGTTLRSNVFLIHEMKIGNKSVSNVRASVGSSIDAPLLVGQSFLMKFGRLTIDNNHKRLILGD